VEGDLDWIVMKALEKERTRRYTTASDLAKDIERYLNNEPILARPPSNWYRLQKFARRNKVTFAAGVVMVFAAGAVFIALAAGLAVSTWLFVKEREARQLAAQAQDEAAMTRAEVLAFGNPELVERVTRAREFTGQLKEATDLVNAQRLQEAEPLLNAMLKESGSGGRFEIQVLELRADVLARTGRFAEAAVDLTRLTQLDPTNHWNWFILAPLLVEVGDEQGYDTLRKDMLDRFENLEEALPAERIVKAATLRPFTDREAQQVDPLLKTVFSEGAGEHAGDAFAQYLDGFQLCKGLVDYREGRPTEARQALQPVLNSTYFLFVPAAYAIQAMCYHQEQQPNKARAALQAGRDYADSRLTPINTNDLGQLWNDILIAKNLLEEAAATLNPPTAQGSTNAPATPQ
jgi:tetratricopeptide (TPR) repeat protein